MAAMTPRDALGRAVLRTVLIIVGVALVLYILYLLRKPITWLVIAAFIAVAMSGPVNLLQRFIHRRGPSIALAYIALIMIPIGLGALIVPSLVNQIEDLAGNVPEYARDVTEFVQDNETLNDLNEKYNFTSEIESAAGELPARIGDAAGLLQDIGVGVVNSIFAAVTILILSIFMVGVGPRYAAAFVRAQPAHRQERVGRGLQRIADAIGNYVGGALLQATIAGVSAFVVLTILGAPFAGPLALVVAFFDLIPVVGATIAAVLIALVMLFVNFPVGLIVWVIWAIAYQQIENYVIQPQIQRRAVEIEPFIVLVSVLFGSTLFGVLGAILAIPTAASLQIIWHEWREYRNETLIRPETTSGQPSAESGPLESPA
ncbi:MAG TPA: AI-2E family transporter [Solirubrobacterales bacterium]|nr:AI-2E family transporter [Solirubrobacterales bacterium]